MPVLWNAAAVAKYTIEWPQRAHSLAAAEAAGLGAKRIESKYSGNLARDVARPKPAGPLRTFVGSSRPYAGMEQHGGTILPRVSARLLIHATRVGAAGQPTRSHFRGTVVASATSVRHKGKHYLEPVVKAFPALFRLHLTRLMPKV